MMQQQLDQLFGYLTAIARATNNSWRNPFGIPEPPETDMQFVEDDSGGLRVEEFEAKVRELLQRAWEEDEQTTDTAPDETFSLRENAWQDMPPERYMDAQGLSELERRIVRILLLQAFCRYMPARPFCGRLSQLMPLVVSRRSVEEQLQVIHALTPLERLRQQGIVQVKGALLCDDPRISLSKQALAEMLGEPIFLLLGLEPLRTIELETSDSPSPSQPRGLLVECAYADAERVAGALTMLTGGKAWRAPKELDVDALSEELLEGAFAAHGGVLVLDEESDCWPGTLRKLSRRLPVLHLVSEETAPCVKYPRASRQAETIQQWLTAVLPGGDGMPAEPPVIHLHESQNETTQKTRRR